MTGSGDTVEIVVEWVAGDPQRYGWIASSDRVEPSQEVADRVPPPPEHYGLVPRTHAADGEELDVLLLRDSAERRPGDHVQARIVGVLRRGDGDHKLVAVDPDNYRTTDVRQIEPERLQAMWRWFRRRHALLGWFAADEARRVLDEARRAWRPD